MSVLNLRLDRLKVFFIVFLTWVGIYLPSLGVPELKGEEGRRVLPAVSMLETGNWIVPYIGGEPYFSKPPLINWLVAASFRLTGRQDELAARLPSVLFVLAFVTALVWLPGAWLSPGARLISAVFFLTSVGMVEKGRLIEIEAVYISLTSLAILCWLDAWMRGRSAWTLWLTPAFFIACGMLTKGPPLLLFYYVAVISILAYAKRLRALLSIQHITAVVVSLGLPLLWAYLVWRQSGGAIAAQASGEMAGRVRLQDIDWLDWAGHVLGSVGNFLPWAIFIPFLWSGKFVTRLPAAQLPVIKGARLGLAIGFSVITLMPGNSARYAMPVFGLASVLLGWLVSARPDLPDRGRAWRNVLLVGLAVCCVSPFVGMILANRGIWSLVIAVTAICLALIVWRERDLFDTPIRLSILSASFAVLLMLQYSLFVVPVIRDNAIRRPVAARLDALVPDHETLYVFKPGYQAFLFYIRAPLEYVVEPNQIDAHIHFLLVREGDYQELEEREHVIPPGAKTLSTFRYRENRDFRLLELSGPAG